LQVDVETLSMLKKHPLTEEGFKQLSGFVPITPVIGDVSIVTIGIGEDKFEYCRECWSGNPLEVGFLQNATRIYRLDYWLLTTDCTFM